MIIDYMEKLTKLIPMKDHLTGKKRKQFNKLVEWVEVEQVICQANGVERAMYIEKDS